LKQFSGELPVLNMPTDYPRPLVQSLEGDKVKFRLEKQLQRDLHALMREAGTTLYMTLMAVLAVLLSKYTDQFDIIIGSPFANRYHPDLENMIGLVVETLVIRNDVPGDKPFEFFLRQVRENILAAYENQPYPYGELMKQLELKNDLSRNPLFDAMLNVREQETGEFTIGGLRFIPFRVDLQVSQCDLILEVIDREEEMGGIEFELGYCSRLFKRESLERFSGYFINIMKEVVRNPALPISRLDMLNKEENRQIAQAGRSLLAADFDF
jgi:non-ribosomal peptide synthetase component F